MHNLSLFLPCAAGVEPWLLAEVRTLLGADALDAQAARAEALAPERRDDVVGLDSSVILAPQVWEADSGEGFTNIEPGEDINDVCVWPRSGLIMVGCDTGEATGKGGTWLGLCVACGTGLCAACVALLQTERGRLRHC